VKSEGIGVITPHNAQKGLLKNMLSEGCENARVDTVERYQGGEADFIIISSTVSDPDYVVVKATSCLISTGLTWRFRE